jgi:hypothetical protein
VIPVVGGLNPLTHPGFYVARPRPNTFFIAFDLRSTATALIFNDATARGRSGCRAMLTATYTFTQQIMEEAVLAMTPDFEVQSIPPMPWKTMFQQAICAVGFAAFAIVGDMAEIPWPMIYATWAVVAFLLLLILTPCVVWSLALLAVRVTRGRQQKMLAEINTRSAHFLGLTAHWEFHENHFDNKAGTFTRHTEWANVKKLKPCNTGWVFELKDRTILYLPHAAIEPELKSFLEYRSLAPKPKA